MNRMKIAIVGLGASGLMAAAIASKENEVYIFEKNDKAGKKIFITGKGRCNLTNACDIFEFRKNIVSNEKFLYHSLNEFDNKNIMEFFEENSLKLKIERGNRVFPYDDKSYLVTDCLINIIKKNNGKIFFNNEVVDIITDNNEAKGIVVKDYKTNNVKQLSFDKIIIATGGLSYKSTGSTGDGYNFAKKLNINVTNLYPALVALDAKEKKEIIKLEGLLLKNVSIKMTNNKNKKIYEDFGEMLFRDGFLDGPIIISASSYITDKLDDGIVLHIDLKPALDIEKLDNRILRDIKEIGKLSIYDELCTLLPKNMIEVFLYRLIKNLNYNENDFVSFQNKKISNMNKIERKNIVNLLKNYTYDIVGTKDINTAIITKGGIDVKEIDNKTMESKKIKNIYFIGEVLDLDALTGGFNMSIAFITGYIAAKSINDLHNHL